MTQNKEFNITHHQMHVHTYAWLTFTYLSITQHLWLHEWACECMLMALKQGNKHKTLIQACKDKRAYKKKA